MLKALSPLQLKNCFRKLESDLKKCPTFEQAQSRQLIAYKMPEEGGTSIYFSQEMFLDKMKFIYLIHHNKAKAIYPVGFN